MRNIFLLLFCLSLAANARAELVNGIYVIVNDAVITYQQVESAIAPAVELLARKYAGQPEVFKQQVQQARSEKVQELVERELILSEFKEGKYRDPGTMIEDWINDRIKKRFGDRATFMKTLQAEGVSYDTYYRQQREQWIIDVLQYQHLSPDKIIISPQKIQSYYNEHSEKFKMGDRVKMRMIVLNKSANDNGAARKMAEEVLKKIEEGASFFEMATVYSEDSYRSQGGDRGWVDRDKTDLNKELVDAAFALKPGQHSNIIELPGACFLITVEEKKSAQAQALAEVRDEIEHTLKADELARSQKNWIDKLKSKSFVRYF
jgi:peptidyl-prolyl cis-trans isomerase SurA